MRKTVAVAMTEVKLDRDLRAGQLYSRLFKIYEELRREKRIEVFGNLDFEVVQTIDGKKQRIAKLKGNRIIVKLDAVSLPRSALRYVIVHEIAHIVAKRHTKRFWKIVEAIYPNFEKGQKLLAEHEGLPVERLKGAERKY
jgi:hypothetical protein